MIFQIEKYFSAAHFYQQTQWSREKNLSVFGKCFTEFGHGHDYRLEIEFMLSAEIDQVQIAKVCDEVCGQLDHQHLNFMISEFKTLIPTTENISLWLWKKIKWQIKAKSSTAQIRKLRLFENPEIWVELENESMTF